jgi:hypothetical protein
MQITNELLFGFVAFVGTYIASRVIRERALRQLSAAQKARLLDAFSGYRTYFMSVAVSLPLLYLFALKLWPENQTLLSKAFLVSFGGLLIITSWLSFRKLHTLGVPANYIKSFLISSGLQYIGIAILFVPLVIRSFG